jgi:hypothetical protein
MNIENKQNKNKIINNKTTNINQYNIDKTKTNNPKLDSTEEQLKIKNLEEENAMLKEQLNKYLLKNKTYYEKNKDEHKQKVKRSEEHTSELQSLALA